MAPESVSSRDAAVHLTPEEWHRRVCAPDPSQGPVVVLDVRNEYEHRIGISGTIRLLCKLMNRSPSGSALLCGWCFGVGFRWFGVAGVGFADES